MTKLPTLLSHQNHIAVQLTISQSFLTPNFSVTQLNFLPQDTPPLAEALQSDHYHIKWTTCSDLPTPMYSAYVAVSNGTIYCSGTTTNVSSQRDVYYYDTRINQWKQLPRPGHSLGVIHIVDDKLTIFGGVDPITGRIFNKVSSYKSQTSSWYSHFPNMLHNRIKPGVATSSGYVIVMGGKSCSGTILDNVEVMNYHLLQWSEVLVLLPVPMWAINPTTIGDNIIIVGYSTATGRKNGCYQISTAEIISFDQSLSPGAVPVQWKKLSAAKYFFTTIIPDSNPAVIIGGSDQGGVTTSGIFLYDIHKNSWRKVDSLTSATDCIGAALLHNHTIIVIGGSSGGVGVEAHMASSLSRVEIGTIIPNQ